MRSVIMRAVRIHKCGGPEVLQLEVDVPIPQPKENEVLIKVRAAGVNPVETYIRSGNFGRLPASFPLILGTDAAGIVSAVGNTVSNMKVGDRVFCVNAAGAYADYTIANSAHVWKLPDNISFSQGAALGIPYFTALRCLKYRASAKAGETLLVHGASGAVGLAACQLAKAMKMNVTGTAGTEKGAKLVQESGAASVLNHKDPDHAQKLRDAAEFDIILEMLANVNLQLDLEVLANFGRIVVVGSRGKIEIDPRLMMMKEATCTGVMLGKTTQQQWTEMGELINLGLTEGWIKPVIDQEFSLANASQAHHAVIDHEKGSCGKIVLTTS